MISLEIFPHTDLGALEAALPRLQILAEKAIPLITEKPGPLDSCFSGIQHVEVSLVDDATIGQVHADFLDDPSPTDVITFHHGEILVSVETALRQAPLHGKSPFEETLLYVIHGLVHLHGHEDATTAGAQRMAEIQESILQRVLHVEIA